MPYIAQEERAQAKWEPRTPGQLNFAITCVLIEAQSLAKISLLSDALCELVNGYWERKKWMGYTAINDVLGALDGALLEYKRRTRSPAKGLGLIIGDVAQTFYDTFAVPYEERKIKENGDVYELS